MPRPTLLLSLGTAGCLFIDPVYKDTCNVWECAPQTAEYVFEVTTADVIECHGTTNLPPPLDQCTTQLGQPTCTIVVDNLDLVSDPGTCNSLNEQEAAACCAENLNWAEGTEERIDNIVDLFNNPLCPITVVDDFSQNVTEDDPVEVEDCETGDTISAAGTGAEFDLRIDPVYSYIDADLGAPTVYSTLNGNALATSDPSKRFLRVFAFGRDFTIGSDTYTRNHVVMASQALVFGTGGNFTVPVSQDFEIYYQGLKSGGEYRIDVAPQVSSGGVLDVVNHKWEYDYYQSGTGTYMQIHLEGELVEVQ